MDFQIIEELRLAVDIARSNAELSEYLASSLRWLLHYSEKYNIPLPEKDKIHLIVKRATELAENIPTTKPEQPRGSNHEANNTTLLVVTKKLVSF